MKCQRVFECIKRSMAKDTTPTLLDHAKQFEVQIDAFDYAIGGVWIEDGHPMTFERRKFNGVKRRYTI